VAERDILAAGGPFLMELIGQRIIQRPLQHPLQKIKRPVRRAEQDIRFRKCSIAPGLWLALDAEAEQILL
jgi:hypothetical protein